MISMTQRIQEYRQRRVDQLATGTPWPSSQTLTRLCTYRPLLGTSEASLISVSSKTTSSGIQWSSRGGLGPSCGTMGTTCWSLSTWQLMCLSKLTWSGTSRTKRTLKTGLLSPTARKGKAHFTWRTTEAWNQTLGALSSARMLILNHVTQSQHPKRPKLSRQNKELKRQKKSLSSLKLMPLEHSLRIKIKQ